MHYYAELGQCSVFPTTEAPEQFVGQVTILKYFAHYMEENLMDVSVFEMGCIGSLSIISIRFSDYRLLFFNREVIYPT